MENNIWRSQRHAFRLLGNSCRGAGGITVIIMENNIWRGFTKEEQHLYHRVEERDGQVEDNLSDTIQVGYEIVSELPKEVHESRMLSLDKTKEVTQLQTFLGDQIGILSWKMDGLTLVLRYENGKLHQAKDVECSCRRRRPDICHEQLFDDAA